MSWRSKVSATFHSVIGAAGSAWPAGVKGGIMRYHPTRANATEWRGVMGQVVLRLGPRSGTGPAIITPQPIPPPLANRRGGRLSRTADSPVYSGRRRLSTQAARGVLLSNRFSEARETY